MRRATQLLVKEYAFHRRDNRRSIEIGRQRRVAVMLEEARDLCRRHAHYRQISRDVIFGEEGGFAGFMLVGIGDGRYVQQFTLKEQFISVKWIRRVALFRSVVDRQHLYGT